MKIFQFSLSYINSNSQTLDVTNIIWVWAASTSTFEGCTFNTGGKLNEYVGKIAQNINLNYITCLPTWNTGTTIYISTC